MIPSGYPARGDPGGNATFFAEQAEIVRRVLGWRCDVLTPRIFRAGTDSPHPPEAEKLPDGGEVWRGAFGYRFPLNRVSAWQKFGGEMFSAYAEKRGPPDLVWAHRITGPGWLARDLRRRLGIPYFIHEHHTRYFRRTVSFFRQADLRRTMRDSVYCAAVGAPQRDAMARRLGVSPESLEVVNNPVNRLFADSDALLERRKAAGGPFVFANVGRLTGVKNQAALLRAFARFLREEDSAAKLRLIGEGPDAEKLRGLIRDLALADSAELAGKLGRAEICAALLSADAFVLPSDVECCCVALLEALCCGLPCATTTAGIGAEVADETTGVLLADAGPDAILAGMKKLRRGRYDSAAIRRRGLEIASPERFCRTVRALLAARGFGEK